MHKPGKILGDTLMDRIGSSAPWHYSSVNTDQPTPTGGEESLHSRINSLLPSFEFQGQVVFEDVKMLTQEEVAENLKFKQTCHAIVARKEFKTWIQLEIESLSEAVIVDLIFLQSNGHLVKEFSFDFEYLDLKSLAFLPRLAKYLPNVKRLTIKGYYAEEEYVSLTKEQETKLFKKKEKDLFKACAKYFPKLKKIRTSGLAFPDPDSIERIFADFTSIIISNESEVILKKMPVA